MATAPDSPGGELDLFDSSVPFKGVVVCCTSIPPEQRTEIAQKTTELGGIHKYDLTPDVTHLIVGEYDTPKYRHVAKERPDISPMAAGWIEAVRALWVQDVDIDFAALEKSWRLKTFETSGGSLKDAEAASRSKLLCCLTGFEDGEQRQKIIGTIVANGADYTGDLTRKVTHLIVAKPEGKKYAAAKSWNVHTVSVEWLHDSVERGMILDEKCYDPVLPKEERGKGAWTRREVKRVSLGKRLRDTAAAAEEQGRRKLRKTASMKLSSQRDNMWGDILGKPPSADPQAPLGEEQPTQPNTGASFPAPNIQTSRSSFDTQGSKLASFGAMDELPVFSSCSFYAHGFPGRRLEVVVNTIGSHGGYVCQSLDDVISNSGGQMAHRLLVVPQDSKAERHPTAPENIHVVTEFFIEKCLHHKRFLDPTSHVIGRPFPVFPIPGFENLAICTAGFTGVDLNHIDRTIRQLGARYEERLKAQGCSLLLCHSLSRVRKQKLEIALACKIPVVSANWLWACITDGAKVPIKRFMFKELKQRLVSEDEESLHFQEVGKQKGPERARERQQGTAEAVPTPARAGVRDIDKSAFAVDKPFPIEQAAAPPRKEISKEDSIATSEFETAPTHQPDVSSAETSKTAPPLSEASSDSLNKSSTSQKRHQPAPPKPRDKEDSEVAPNDEAAVIVERDEAITDLVHAAAPRPEKSPSKPKSATLPAAERLALSARLTTLLDTTTDHPPTVQPAAAAAAPAPLRRRRQILGRAISNVSAASSGSVDSSGGGAGGSAPAGLGGPGGSVSVDGVDAAAADNPGGSENRSFSSTQLQYEDPDADAQKERLKGNKGRKVKAVEKITLASAGGYDVAGAGAAAGLGRAAGGLRSRRR